MTQASELAQLQLIVSLASAGETEEAAQRATGIATRDIAADAWFAIGRANANMQRWEQAAGALENASSFAPDSHAIRLERALLAEKRGDDAGALASLQVLAAEGAPSARESSQLLGHLARSLAFAGRGDEAEGCLVSALAQSPADPGLHKQLAELRWRLGRTPATLILDRAIENHPEMLPLRLIAADHLRAAGDTARASSLLESSLQLAPDAPALLTSSGVLLDELGREEEALKRLRRASQLAPTSVVARRNLIPALLRAGSNDEALRVIDGLLVDSPDDQLLIAWRATALRLRGDPGYELLHDYRRLVRVHDLPPPDGFDDIAVFTRALALELEALHRLEQRPLAQSLRGGSQTERNLPVDPVRHPAIAAFFRIIDAPIRGYIESLEANSSHPTDRRRSRGHRFAGSWSVHLKPGGFHINHVHPQGWISSAFYIELPENMGSAESDYRAGWLKFGEPGMVRPVCAPDHFVEPRVGRLVLFPSHFWHGTVPFESGGRRLTAAFDVVPC